MIKRIFADVAADDVADGDVPLIADRGHKRGEDFGK
jgi:hypothetical protein